VAADEPIVIDTNILFSVLLSDSSRIAAMVLNSPTRFLICETALVELFQHKEKLLRAARPDASDLVRVYHRLLRKLDLVREDLISQESWATAMHLCKEVDPGDTPHVAATLHVDGLLWTGDRKLKRGLEQRGFTRFYVPPSTLQ
jgi:predicted nucleic acid-binding protein